VTGDEQEVERRGASAEVTPLPEPCFYLVTLKRSARNLEFELQHRGGYGDAFFLLVTRHSSLSRCARVAVTRHREPCSSRRHVATPSLDSGDAAGAYVLQIVRHNHAYVGFGIELREPAS
jgi:hypothetical protein